MTTQEFIHALGLESIADEMHRHPASGSDWSIRTLLEKFGKHQAIDFYLHMVNDEPPLREHLEHDYNNWAKPITND